MHIYLLILHLLFMFPVKGSQFIQEDTCKLYQVKIDKPFREIIRFSSYYDNFTNNDSSEYQLILISIPYDDSNSYGLYFSMTDSVSVTMIGSGEEKREKRYDKHDTECLSAKFDVIEQGGYASICDLNAYNLVYYLCMIKRKGEIVFQYQGVNKNILRLGKEGNQVGNVISLIKELKEW